MPIYCCPKTAQILARREKNERSIPGRCTYSVVVGPRTPFPGAMSRSKAEISEPDRVILIVETPDPFCWMNPYADLSYGVAMEGINEAAGGLGSFHPAGGVGGCYAGMANGRSMFLCEGAPELWESLRLPQHQHSSDQDDETTP